MQVAQTILNQLGGNRFLAMTGVTQLVGGDTTLSFKLPANKTKANKMLITLTPADTYDVTTYKVNFKAATWSVVDSREGVYSDSLEQVFESLTGLYARL